MSLGIASGPTFLLLFGATIIAALFVIGTLYLFQTALYELYGFGIEEMRASWRRGRTILLSGSAPRLDPLEIEEFLKKHGAEDGTYQSQDEGARSESNVEVSRRARPEPDVELARLQQEYRELDAAIAGMQQSNLGQFTLLTARKRQLEAALAAARAIKGEDIPKRQRSFLTDSDIRDLIEDKKGDSIEYKNAIQPDGTIARHVALSREPEDGAESPRSRPEPDVVNNNTGGGVSKKQVSLKQCRRCGEHMREDSKDCPRCGFPVECRRAERCTIPVFILHPLREEAARDIRRMSQLRLSVVECKSAGRQPPTGNGCRVFAFAKCHAAGVG